MARVLGLAGPGDPLLRGRLSIAGGDRAGRSPEGSSGGWVPEQPGPPRPGAVGQLLGQGRHRETTPLRGRLPTPAGLAGALVRPSPRAVIGLALVVVLAVAVVLVRVWRAEVAAAPVEVASRSSATPGALVSRTVSPGTGVLGPSVGALPASSPGPAASSGSGGTAAQLTVHVVGAVARPGVIRIASGSRLVDALQRCGGPVRGADLAAVNLARVLTDGEQVVVPLVGRPGGAAAPGAGSRPGVSPSGSRPGGGPVNLNSADAAALEELPGIGPKLAERIVAWRTEHGRFSSVDELGEVSGIGDKILSQLRQLVTV